MPESEKFQRGDLERFRSAKKDYDRLAQVDARTFGAVQYAQKRLTKVLTSRAGALIDLALAHLESAQCQACWGFGYTVEWIASDEQRRHRCAACSGTGQAMVGEVRR